MNNIKKNEKYKYLDLNHDENYMYLDLSDDPEMLEGETEDEFAKRCKDRIKSMFGVDYEEIKESEGYKLFLNGFYKPLE